MNKRFALGLLLIFVFVGIVGVVVLRTSSNKRPTPKNVTTTPTPSYTPSHTPTPIPTSNVTIIITPTETPTVVSANESVGTTSVGNNNTTIVYVGTGGGGGGGGSPVTRIPRVISCDSNGDPKDVFYFGDTVYFKASGLPPYTTYRVWIQPNPVHVGQTLDRSKDPSGSQEIVTSNRNGIIKATAIWNIPTNCNMRPTEWDIVLDPIATATGYVRTSSVVDSFNTAGFVAPLSELGTSILTLIGILAIPTILKRFLK